MPVGYTRRPSVNGSSVKNGFIPPAQVKDRRYDSMLLEDLISDYDDGFGVDANGLAAVLRDKVPGIDAALSSLRHRKEYAVLIGKNDGSWICDSVYEHSPKRVVGKYARSAKRKPCAIDVSIRNDLEFCVGHISLGHDEYRLLIVPEDAGSEYGTVDEMYDELLDLCSGRWASNYTIQCI